MEFWGVEVKPGQKPKVEVKNDHFLHISQCALSEPKEGVDATMFVKVDGQKLAIGTLTKQTSMFQFDLVFEKDFELSHNAKSSSVCFTGYMVFQPPEGDKREDESVQRNENKLTAEGAAKTPASDEKPAEMPASDKEPAETPAPDKKPAGDGVETPASHKMPAEGAVETPPSDKMPAEVVVETPPSDKKPKVAKENSDDNERAVGHVKKRKLPKENSGDNDRAVRRAEKPKVAKKSTGDTARQAAAKKKFHKF